MSSAGTVSVRDLGMTYGSGSTAHPVLSGISFQVAPASLTCIVGPSGAGKTTLLRCLGGLLRPTTGEVLFDGQVVREPPKTLAPVFQDYSRSLLPWLSVEGNITLPLRGSGMSAKDRREAARTALAGVGLHGVEELYPWQLSGGMQQRVAIARALAYGPKALLMDEPFASVDAQTRAELEDLVLDVRARFGVTIVVVTHDIDESIYLSDRVVVLAGSPARVVEEVTIDLAQPRDQLATKAEARFGELRAHLFGLIKNRQPRTTADASATTERE